MESNDFVADQAAQTYNIDLKSTYLNRHSSCEKPSISKCLIGNTKYFYRIPRFSIETLGILVETLGFLFEILGISKICDSCISYMYLCSYVK